MNNKIKELFSELAGLCIEKGVFLNYSPHVNTCEIYYFKKGRSGKEELIYIVNNLKIIEENLENAINKLKEFEVRK